MPNWQEITTPENITPVYRDNRQKILYLFWNLVPPFLYQFTVECVIEHVISIVVSCIPLCTKTKQINKYKDTKSLNANFQILQMTCSRGEKN